MKRSLILLILFSFLSVFAIQTRTEDNRKLEDISKVIGLYLQNKLMMGEDTALKASEEYLKGPENFNCPAVKVLEYLSGNTGVKPENIALATEDKPDIWALASLAFFVRTEAVEKTPQVFFLENRLNNYLKFSAGSNLECVRKWRNSAELWKKWCAGGFRELPGLDPLLAAKSIKIKKPSEKKKTVVAKNAPAPHPDIDNVNIEEFIKRRKELFSARPCPASLEFDMQKVRDYIDSLKDKKLMENESIRCKLVIDSKNYLLRLMRLTPYHGKIVLKNNEAFNSTVSMANIYNLRIKNPKTGKTENYKWDQIAFRQYINFFNYYALMKRKGTGGEVTERQSIRNAAEDLLILAVLCDWYGYYRQALKFAGISAKLCPDLKDDINKILFDSPAESN